jgi:hypothetical protein
MVEVNLTISTTILNIDDLNIPNKTITLSDLIKNKISHKYKLLQQKHSKQKTNRKLKDRKDTSLKQ